MQEPRASGLCPVLNLPKQFRESISMVKRQKRNYNLGIKHIFSTTLHSPPEPEKITKDFQDLSSLNCAGTVEIQSNKSIPNPL